MRVHLQKRVLRPPAPDVLTALQPCWTMSPLLVSQLLPADRPYFDVVEFDDELALRVCIDAVEASTFDDPHPSSIEKDVTASSPEPGISPAWPCGHRSSC